MFQLMSSFFKQCQLSKIIKRMTLLCGTCAVLETGHRFTLADCISRQLTSPTVALNKRSSREALRRSTRELKQSYILWAVTENRVLDNNNK